MTEGKTLDEVYRDRNLLALAFAEAINQLDAGGYYNAVWRPAEGDDADADEWAIVQVRTPEGQVSWHVPRELAEASNLRRSVEPWDGHDREEKNRRLARYVGINERK